MQAQRAWENYLSAPWVLPLTLIETIGTSPDWPILLFQALFYVVFVSLTVVALRRLPLAYGWTMALFLLPPMLSSWQWSVSRHVLIGFPAFIVLAQWAERTWARRVILVVMLPLLIVATLLFVNGFWIA
jgi:hypothetical protein